MTNIKGTLTSKIDELLKIDSAIYHKDPLTNIAAGFSGINRRYSTSQDSLSQKMSSTDTEESDRLSDADYKMKKTEGTDDVINKKKKFSNIRKVINGIRSNKKSKKNSEVVSRDPKQKESVGDTQNSMQQSKNNRSYKGHNSSKISRMWNSLFPNKTGPMIIDGETDMKERSTKTLGRLFGIRQKQRTSNKETIENDNESSMMNRSTVTLGRKFSKGINFKNYLGRNNKDLPPPLQAPSEAGENNLPMMTDISLQNKTAPIQI